MKQTTTTTDSPEFTRSERTRMVAAAHPHLIEAMEKAAQEYHENEDVWQQQATRQQRAGGMPKRDLESPYRRALREAAKAVTDAADEIIASSQIDAES